MVPFDLIIRNFDQVDIAQVYFSATNKQLVEQVIKEHQHIDVLRQYGLNTVNKILLHGHSGCGKTTTAKAIAKALKKPIIITELSNLISAKIGETSKQIKSLFDKANREKAILFFDEFDLIGKMRSVDDNDVGEMRRLVNTIIQLMDYLNDEAIIIGATNFYELIDTALLRRFELTIKFDLPTVEELDAYYDDQLARFPENINKIERKYNISYAEAKDELEREMKARIILMLENGLIPAGNITS